MKRNWRRFRNAALPAAIVLAGSMMSAPAWANTCKVTLGMAGPMSGGAAAFGLAGKAAVDFEAAWANKHGGLKVGDKRCDLKVSTYDTKYSVAGGAAAANYFASEGIHASLGPVTSLGTKGFRPVAARNGIVAFDAAYMPTAITPKFPLMFHALQMPNAWGPLLVKTAAQQFKFKTVLLTAPNDEGGEDGASQEAKIYNKAGIKTTEAYYQRGTTNFAPLVQRIMMANPDAVELSTCPPGDAELIVKQLYAAGYSGVIGSLGGVGLRPIALGAGGVKNLKNVYWLQLTPTDDPGVIRMRQDYKKLMGKAAPSNGEFPIWVLASEVMVHAITKAGTADNAQKIATALRNTVPDSRYMGKHGWRGEKAFGINQELSFPVGLGMIVNGKMKKGLTVQIPAQSK